jgi:hypothetical protein
MRDNYIAPFHQIVMLGEHLHPLPLRDTRDAALVCVLMFAADYSLYFVALFKQVFSQPHQVPFAACDCGVLPVIGAE